MSEGGSGAPAPSAQQPSASIGLPTRATLEGYVNEFMKDRPPEDVTFGAIYGYLSERLKRDVKEDPDLRSLARSVVKKYAESLSQSVASDGERAPKGGRGGSRRKKGNDLASDEEEENEDNEDDGTSSASVDEDDEEDDEEVNDKRTTKRPAARSAAASIARRPPAAPRGKAAAARGKAAPKKRAAASGTAGQRTLQLRKLVTELCLGPTTYRGLPPPGPEYEQELENRIIDKCLSQGVVTERRLPTPEEVTKAIEKREKQREMEGIDRKNIMTQPRARRTRKVVRPPSVTSEESSSGESQTEDSDFDETELSRPAAKGNRNNVDARRKAVNLPPASAGKKSTNSESSPGAMSGRRGATRFSRKPELHKKREKKQPKSESEGEGSKVSEGTSHGGSDLSDDKRKAAAASSAASDSSDEEESRAEGHGDDGSDDDDSSKASSVSTKHNRPGGESSPHQQRRERITPPAVSPTGRHADGAHGHTSEPAGSGDSSGQSAPERESHKKQQQMKRSPPSSGNGNGVTTKRSKIEGDDAEEEQEAATGASQDPGALHSLTVPRSEKGHKDSAAEEDLSPTNRSAAAPPPASATSPTATNSSEIGDDTMEG